VLAIRTMMMRTSLVFGIALAALAACGGDDGAESGTKADPVEQVAGSSAEPGTVVCGAKSCKLPDGVTGEICCRDEFAGVCGLKDGATCSALPEMDERCPVPDIELPTRPGMTIPKPYGCCTSDNECGLDFGVGCQPRTIICMGPIGAEGAAKLEPQTCDGEPLPLPPGCGMGTM
jgi:hypothetical protein